MASVYYMALLNNKVNLRSESSIQSHFVRYLLQNLCFAHYCCCNLLFVIQCIIQPEALQYWYCYIEFWNLLHQCLTRLKRKIIIIINKKSNKLRDIIHADNDCNREKLEKLLNDKVLRASSDSALITSCTFSNISNRNLNMLVLYNNSTVSKSRFYILFMLFVLDLSSILFRASSGPNFKIKNRGNKYCFLPSQHIKLKPWIYNIHSLHGY